MANVLLISREYSPLSGGAGVYINAILNHTKKHKYHVITNLAKLSFLSFIHNPKNVDMEYSSLPRVRYLNTVMFAFYSLFSSFGKDIDCVVGNELVGNVMGALVSFVKRKPFVSIVHNVSYKGKLKGVRELLLKWIFNSSDVIVVNGKKLEDDISSIFGTGYKSKIVHIVPGVEVLHFDKIEKPRRHVILFVGAIYGHKKGIEYIIQAMPKVIDKIDCELWIAGSSKNQKFYQWLKTLAEELGVSNRVNFLGRVGDVFSYYDACDIFVLPSYSESETFGIPCIEASAMGKPVIATDILERTGVVIDGETGIIVPRKSAKKLSDAIIKLLKDKKFRVRLGKNGRLHAKKFSWAESAKQFENVIDGIE